MEIGDEIQSGHAEEPTRTREFCDQLMRQTVCERVVKKSSARFLNGSTVLVLCANRTSATKRNPVP